jgi:hypothetical protein
LLSNDLNQRRINKSQETSPNDSQITIDSTNNELNDEIEENRGLFYQWVKRINTIFSKFNPKRRSFLKKNNSVNDSNDNSNLKRRKISTNSEDLNHILQNAFEENAINQVLSTDY